jgi:hypothetical protein
VRYGRAVFETRFYTTIYKVLWTDLKKKGENNLAHVKWPIFNLKYKVGPSITTHRHLNRK